MEYQYLKKIEKVAYWIPTLNLRWRMIGEDYQLQQMWQSDQGEQKWEKIEVVRDEEIDKQTIYAPI